ncbi:MAG: GNAT family N-acetyltransferase, partial [Proteobacteria bacterium]|nr:GNAT family N-acetyltransferase [Pseudomonadota bacterium]
MKKEIHVWHLEITDPHLIPTAPASGRYVLNQLHQPTPEVARFLYLSVGAPWTWYMRLHWTWAQWQTRIDEVGVSFWLASCDGMPIGYFEFEQQTRGVVEICYFGLLPQYIGQGHGKALLNDAVYLAWQTGGRRVWLHTCNLDHPSALPNYQARGFQLFKEEDFVLDIPDEPIQPWHGAQKKGRP